MNPHLTAALVSERQHELERLAGCCTPAAEHRRAAHRTLRARLAGLRARRAAPAGACCPAT